MEKAQRDKEKEKKKKSKAKKKERDEKEVLDAAQAHIALLEQKAAAIREGKNRQVSRIMIAPMHGVLDIDYSRRIFLTRVSTIILTVDGRRVCSMRRQSLWREVVRHF